MLMHGGGGRQEYVGDRDSCLVELQLWSETGDVVNAQLRIGDQPQKRTQVTLPFSKLKSLSDDASAYGAVLGEALFKNTELGMQYDKARAHLAGKELPMRFRVVLDAALDVVHWERLCHPDGTGWVPIASGGSVPFSRFVYANGVVRSNPVVRRPVQVLLVVASPNDLATSSQFKPIEPAEAASARAMFDSLGTGNTQDASTVPDVQVTEVSSFGATRPTLANLTAAMATCPDIVHVLCHGVPEDTETGLLLEKSDGTGSLEKQQDIVAALRSGAERPHLVFFAACNSALPSGRAALVSLGPALAATGIDAVLAMSDAVALDTAQSFAAQFYKQLFMHGKVDRAANEARAFVQTAWDWGVPVLYNFASEGRILDFDPGGIGGAFLNKLNHVARVAASTRNQAPNDLPGHVMSAVDELIEELERSHKFLVQGVAAPFRAVGDDRATFQRQFLAFFNQFKSDYDTESWRSQNTSCTKVRNISAVALPFFEETMRNDPASLAALEGELKALSDIDGDILYSMRQFLDTMNEKVEEIRKLLNSDLDRAIQLKRDYEEQLSPTFRRSRELLAELGQSAGRLQAA
jgi:hypothetical protein